MKSLRDKVDKFLRRNNDQDDIRRITKAAEEVADEARELYKKHRANGELTPLLIRMGKAAVNISDKHSRVHIQSSWVQDIRESMNTIEELMETEKKELV